LQNKLTSQVFLDKNFYKSGKKNLNLNTQSIKILMIGDVVGRSGRKILKKIVPFLKKELEIDFITINGENLAGGFGITKKIYDEIKFIGVDAITMGNHWRDKPDIHDLRMKHLDIVLPQNLIGVLGAEKIPSFYLKKYQKNLCILNLMGNFAMREEYYCPFQILSKEKENFLNQIKSGSHIFIADVHAESSSEKQAIAWFYDGILAALIGTHTHTPTSDERLTEKGTAFLTDVGMTGAYDSVIGMEKNRVISRFLNPLLKVPYCVAEKSLWFCGFLVEVCPKSLLSFACHRFQYRDSAEKAEGQWTISSVERSFLYG
jgi:metallophosphoesterase (TIGR00282 family)